MNWKILMCRPEQKIIQDLQRQISILEEQVNNLTKLRQQDREELNRLFGPVELESDKKSEINWTNWKFTGSDE